MKKFVRSICSKVQSVFSRANDFVQDVKGDLATNTIGAIIVEGRTVVFGHTPTINLNFDSPMTVWDVGYWIGIDCGCMFPEQGDPWSGAAGRLACLRLDDMEVFYSEEPYAEES